MKLGFGKEKRQKDTDPGEYTQENSAVKTEIASSYASTDADSDASENSASEKHYDLSKLKKKDLLEIMLRQGEEIDALRAEVSDLKEKLADREFALDKVGSIAEASLAVTDIFKEADKAAMTYLANLRRLAEEGIKK